MMAAIQITPDGIGQAAMLLIAGIGVALLVDCWSFVSDGPSFLSSFRIAIHLDERVRALAEFLLGIMLFLFGMGIWTVQVGAAAIITCLLLAMGNYWSTTEARGSANDSRTTTVHTTKNAPTHIRRECPLTPAQKQWCKDDHDGDGTINQYDSDFNGKGQGMANCKNGYYISDTCQ